MVKDGSNEKPNKKLASMRRNLAVADYLDKKYSCMRSAAEAYDVKLTTFARALAAAKHLGCTPATLKGAATNSAQHDSIIRLTTAKQSVGRPTVLSAEEEKGLVDMICRQSKARMAMTREQVAYYIMALMAARAGPRRCSRWRLRF